LIVHNKVVAATKKHTYKMEAQMKQDAPYETGHLKRSLRSTFYKGGLTGETSTNVEYASYLEFGTRYMHPRPFMFWAFTFTRMEYLEELREILEELD